MIRHLSLAVALAALAAGCSSSSSPSSESDASAPPPDAADSAAPADSSVPDASVVEDGASPEDASKAAVHTVDWSFAVSDPSLNGGLGLVTNIAIGDSIAWHNTDTSMPHTATSIDGSAFAFDTGDIAPGATSAPVKFTQAGTFTYYCTLHTIQSMKGTVTVK